MESPPLEVFKDHGDVALVDTVSGMEGAGWRLDFIILVALSNLNDPAILPASHSDGAEPPLHPHLSLRFCRCSHDLLFPQENGWPRSARRTARRTWWIRTAHTWGLTWLLAGASWAAASSAPSTAGASEEKMGNAPTSHILEKVNLPQRAAGVMAVPKNLIRKGKAVRAHPHAAPSFPAAHRLTTFPGTQHSDGLSRAKSHLGLSPTGFQKLLCTPQ